MEESKRNHLIDLIKGLLIILVIIGHFLPGTLSKNPIRYIIYSFHMPAFFYISGTLYSGRVSLKDYILRLGIPWLLAVQVYYALLNFRTLSIASYLKVYIVPYYHLWFVVGFFFCIIVVKLSRENKWLLLSLSIILAFLSAILKGSEFIVWKFFDYTVRPQYLLFFTIGLLAKVKKDRGIKRTLVPVSIFIIFLPIGFQIQDVWWEQFVRYLLLCGIFYNIDLWQYNVKPSVIGNLGRMTFPIYLWHVVGKLGALYFTDGAFNLCYYICTNLYMFALVVVLRINKNEKIRFLIGR